MTPPPYEPFTVHLLPDLLRVGTIAGALLLIVLVLRLVWVRLTRPDEHDPVRVHPAAMLSYCAALAMIVARRTESLGTPLDAWMFASVVVVALGYVGVLARVELHARQPWHRR